MPKSPSREWRRAGVSGFARTNFKTKSKRKGQGPPGSGHGKHLRPMKEGEVADCHCGRCSNAKRA